MDDRSPARRNSPASVQEEEDHVEIGYRRDEDRERVKKQLGQLAQ